MMARRKRQPPVQCDMFDLTRARIKRDEGMQRAVAGTDGEQWKDYVQRVFVQFFMREWHGPFTTENFRTWCIARDDYIRPRSPNCWGSITNALARAGHIRKTGLIRQPLGVKSHASIVQEWELQSPPRTED